MTEIAVEYSSDAFVKCIDVKCILKDRKRWLHITSSYPALYLQRNSKKTNYAQKPNQTKLGKNNLNNWLSIFYTDEFSTIFAFYRKLEFTRGNSFCLTPMFWKKKKVSKHLFFSLFVESAWVICLKHRSPCQMWQENNKMADVCMLSPKNKLSVLLMQTLWK